MVVRALLIVVLCTSACREDAPLERLSGDGASMFEVWPLGIPPPPPPPPPPHVTLVGPPPEIAAFVRHRFGLPEITFYELEYADEPPADNFMGHVIKRRARLEDAQVIALVDSLAGDEAFADASNLCSCGPLGVRISRGREHVDFIVDCANVYLNRPDEVGSLAPDVSELVDRLHVAVLR